METMPLSWLPSQMIRCRNPWRRIRKPQVSIVFARIDGEGFFGHNFGYTSVCGVPAFCHDPAHEIAFGKHAYEPAVPQHRNGANVTVDHRSRHIQYGLLGLGMIGFLSFDEIVDAGHVAPPGLGCEVAFQRFEASFRAEYTLKSGGFKESAGNSTKGVVHHGSHKAAEKSKAMVARFRSSISLPE